MKNRNLFPRRISSLRGFACLTAVMMIAACSTPKLTPKESGASWVTYQHEVGFASPASSLSKFNRTGINRFLQQLDIVDSDRVFIRARQGRESHQVAAVAKHLRALRLRPEIIVAPGARNPVTIEVGRYLVKLPRCPDWSKRTGVDYANRRSNNLGCATATNLGLMVANPGDLLQGRPMGPSDGARGASAIRKYREGKMEKLPTIIRGGK